MKKCIGILLGCLFGALICLWLLPTRTPIRDIIRELISPAVPENWPAMDNPDNKVVPIKPSAVPE